MRPTGFGHRSPHQFTADFNYPLRKADGTNLDMNYKSISDKRRELLFI